MMAQVPAAPAETFVAVVTFVTGEPGCPTLQPPPTTHVFVPSFACRRHQST